jgi:simple sugar transport system permease protein
MQFDSGVAADIIQIIQALVLAFVAAPVIMRSLFRLRAPRDKVEAATLSSGWAG